MILGFSLDACKHTKQKSPVVQESSVSEDSVKYIYEGILPAADAAGIRYTLTISAPQNSGDGTFVLQQAYLGTGEKDTIFTTVVAPPAITYLTISFSNNFFILSIMKTLLYRLQPNSYPDRLCYLCVCYFVCLFRVAKS